MFTWLNKQGVQSDLGFVVQRTGRFTCEYREGGRSIEIEVETQYAGNTSGVAISKDAFAKWGNPRPFHDTPIAEQERLMKNFKDAMEFQGLFVSVYQ